MSNYPSLFLSKQYVQSRDQTTPSHKSENLLTALHYGLLLSLLKLYAVYNPSAVKQLMFPHGINQV